MPMMDRAKVILVWVAVQELQGTKDKKNKKNNKNPKHSVALQLSSSTIVLL